MPAIRTSEVFVPGLYPRHTYNPRDDRALEQGVRQYIEDGGSILTLVGPTKTGKTVLLEEVLPDAVFVPAQGVTDADTFWALVGGLMGASVERRQSEGTSQDVQGGGQLGFPGIGQVGGHVANGSSSTTDSDIINVSAAEVRRLLEASGRVLVVDDFHFIPAPAQREIVQALKPLVFRGLRVIMAAISHRVLDVPRAVEDMGGRVEPLVIELWTPDELLVIARRGFEVLGVTDHDELLGRHLAENSFGSPHLMQKLCRELVREVNGVHEATTLTSVLVAPSDWAEFFGRHVDGNAGQWFARLRTGPPVRGNTRVEYLLVDGRRVDGYGLILAAIALTGPELSISRQRLNQAIVELTGGGPQPEPHQLTRFLKHMTAIARRKLDEDVLPDDVLDQGDGIVTYTLGGVEPVVEYVEDGAVSTLSIADPFFAFYVRWAPSAELG